MKRLVCAIICIVLVGASALPAYAAPAEVDAKSAVLMDMYTGTVLYEQNAHAPLRPASVTKVMTMLLIMEAIDSGRLRWEDTVTASETAAAKGGSQIYLKVGETMTVSDMVKSIAVSSANDCACAMAEHLCGSEAAFADAMNDRAKELGMEDTYFVNCTGLDDGEGADRHLTSAYDIALMSRELMKNHPDIQKFTTIWMDTVRDGAFGLANTNKLIRFYPGATGLKTGFTQAAGYCLSATAAKGDLSLIAAVMGSETSQKRFAACKSLLDYGFASYTLAKPELPEEMTVPVTLGTEKTVKAVLAEDGCRLLEKADKSTLTTVYKLEGSVAAPVSIGQRLGTVQMKAGQQVIAQIPLVAAEAVPKKTFGDVFLQLLKCLCMKA